MGVLERLFTQAQGWLKGQPPGLERLDEAGSVTAAPQDSPDIDALMQEAAACLADGQTERGREALRRGLAISKQNAAAPLAAYRSVEARSGAVAAERFLQAYIAERDAAIFEAIENHVQYLRTSRYVDVPLDVQIETLARCNAACTFCQYPELTRIGDRMPDALIDKIVDDLDAFPKDLQTSLTLYGVNEPFLDKRIWDLMRKVTDRLPHMPIALNTNGVPLNEGAIDRLLDYNVARLSVSFNDHRKEEYQRVMGISYERALAVLDTFERKKANGELRFPIGVTRAGDGSIHDLEFIEWVSERFPHLSNNFSPRFDWVDPESLMANVAAPDAGCTHWYDMTIRADGQVSFCCIDGHITWPKGDVKTERLLDIYNKPEYRRLRTEAVVRKDIEQCRTCRSG